MNAEDIGSRISYYGRLIKQPVLFTENLENSEKL